MPTKPQTVFRVKLATDAVDLREPPFVRDRGNLDAPRRLRGHASASASRAREAGVGAIRYESVRDPQHGGCCAVLRGTRLRGRRRWSSRRGCCRSSRERVVWQRTGALRVDEHEFAADGWTPPRTPRNESMGAQRRGGS